MIDLNAIVTLAGMLASLAVVYLLLEASSIAFPAAAKRAATWFDPMDENLGWAQRQSVRAASGIASRAGRAMHSLLTRPTMNNRPIRQAA